MSRRVLDFGELVKFSHTIFLFPFALAAVVLAAREEPLRLETFLWVVVALVAARSAAMIMNRLADLPFDAQNPRTAGRSLVTGQVSPRLAWLWLLLTVAVFVSAAGMLNPLCLWLSPLALAWVLGYSYTKRFTSLCHLWLGVATALAPLGAWVAVTGTLDWRLLVLGGAVAAWVAGFDIIYACQDVEFDRGQGLLSLPACRGVGGGLRISRLLHALAAAGFLALAPLFGLGGLYLGGVAAAACILCAEHVLVARRAANIPLAFFTLNGVVSILLFLCLLADTLWQG
ncbi:MAG: putative 4-hydroxybenzoate polyprenyltransferase [Deltaproteobacteria bacterium]|nr:putative 4-hydroxybenzoate polyprenyltransferase [Deltaproteobacteria bacterium]